MDDTSTVQPGTLVVPLSCMDTDGMDDDDRAYFASYAVPWPDTTPRHDAVTLPRKVAEDAERLMAEHGYNNGAASIRAALAPTPPQAVDGPCPASSGGGAHVRDEYGTCMACGHEAAPKDSSHHQRSRKADGPDEQPGLVAPHAALPSGPEAQDAGRG